MFEIAKYQKKKFFILHTRKYINLTCNTLGGEIETKVTLLGIFILKGTLKVPNSLAYCNAFSCMKTPSIGLSWLLSDKNHLKTTSSTRF